MITQRVQHGFSLIELVIVVVIMASIATIAIPRFADAGTGRSLSNSIRIIESDIEAYKLKSRAKSMSHTVKFYLEKEMYVVFEGTTLSRENAVLIRDMSESPFECELSRTNLGVDSLIVISPYGQVSPGGKIGVLRGGIEVYASIDGTGNEALSVNDELDESDIDRIMELSNNNARVGG